MAVLLILSVTGTSIKFVKVNVFILDNRVYRDVNSWAILKNWFDGWLLNVVGTERGAG